MFYVGCSVVSQAPPCKSVPSGFPPGAPLWNTCVWLPGVALGTGGPGHCSDLRAGETGLAWGRQSGAGVQHYEKRRLKMGFCNQSRQNIQQMKAEEGKRCYSHL